MTEYDDRGPDRREVPLSVDSLLDLLGHPHRRAVLRTLLEAPDDVVAADELIGRLQDREESRTGERPSWEHLTVALHHVHVPKLSDAGVVEYDAAGGRYVYRPRDRLETWLDHVESVHEPER